MTEKKARVSNGMSQVKGAAVAVVALVIGLVIGLVVGLFIPYGQVAPTSTVTKTESILTTVMQTEVGLTSVERTLTLTETMTYLTSVQMPITATLTETMTQTTTKQEQITFTITTLGTGKTLLTYSGSATSNSPPFTATTAIVKVILTVTADDPAWAGASWYIYKVGAVAYTTHGGVDEKVGTFEFYGYDLIPGGLYYVKMNTANCEWTVTVEEM